MRIVHLGKFYPPASGGIETHLQTLARSQAALGADVTVLCVNHADARGRDVTWSKFCQTSEVEDRDGEVKVVRLGRVGSIARFDACPALLSRLRRLGRQADVLHLHTPNPSMLLGLAAAGGRVPVVVTHHSDVIKQKLLWHAVAPFERCVYGRAARILPTSSAYVGGSAVLKR